jgi:hypothetical protein
MSEISYTSKDIEYLLSPQAIRARTHALFLAAMDGKTHFRVHEEKLDEVSEFVLQVTLENYPDLKIPFHSRWGHFQAGDNGKKIDRLSELDALLGKATASERARAKLDLAIVSVLLDAGAGMGWRYREPSTGCTLGRSEGLAIASFRMFLDGCFSSDPTRPLQADAKGLQNLSREVLEKGFQVTELNPLIGVEGRLELLRQLGRTIENDPVHFPPESGCSSRPGNLYDFCATHFPKSLRAPDLLGAVLRGLGPIWPGRIQLGSTNLGDVWTHPLLGTPTTTESLIPFHKLSQWLTYSLIEPLIEGGLNVVGVEELTGLAEYRNGGLLLDRGLIELRDPAQAQASHRPDSPLVIEWRALTVVLLERIAERVRTKLGKTPADLPLAKVLEGGTWWAGRRAAASLRTDGGPPLKIVSDGTVF